MAGKTRTYIGLTWMAAALSYTAYAAYSYSGLFQRFCDWQDHIFGAHDTSIAFVGTLLLCSLPGYLVAPELWKPRRRANPTGVATVLDPLAQRRTLTVLGGGCLLVGMVAGLEALTASHRTPVVVTIDLLEGEEARDVSRADQVIVNGMQHLDASAVLTTTTNGSASSEMFLPFTGKDWNTRQPIRYVLREGVVPHELQERDETHPLRFGPAAILRHALPGEVRADWQKRGYTLSPALIVLDENLASQHITAWLVCFFGVLLGLVFLGMGIYIPRALAAAAQKRSSRAL